MSLDLVIYTNIVKAYKGGLGSNAGMHVFLFAADLWRNCSI